MPSKKEKFSHPDTGLERSILRKIRIHALFLVSLFDNLVFSFKYVINTNTLIHLPLWYHSFRLIYSWLQPCDSRARRRSTRFRLHQRFICRCKLIRKLFIGSFDYALIKKKKIIFLLDLFSVTSSLGRHWFLQNFSFL